MEQVHAAIATERTTADLIVEVMALSRVLKEAARFIEEITPILQTCKRELRRRGVQLPEFLELTEDGNDPLGIVAETTEGDQAEQVEQHGEEHTEG